MSGGRNSGRSNLTEATYRIEIWDRVTGAVVDGCVFDRGAVQGSFNRTLDAISAGEVIITQGANNCADGGDCDCTPIERQHELVFIRDDCDEPAWIGPIVRIVDDPFQGTLSIKALDRLYWWEGAPSVRDIIFTAPNEIDIRDLFFQYIELAEDYQPSQLDYWFNGNPGELPDLGGLEVESDLLAGESIWSKMLGLAKSALDFTVVGPHLYWGSPEIPIEDGPTILPIHFSSPPIIDRDASSVASQVAVIGAGGVAAFYPEDDVDTGRGKRTLFVSDTNINTQQEAQALAEQVYEQNREPADFIITGDGSASAAFPVSMKGLIPGRNFPIIANGQCLSSEDVLQLFNVVVEVGSIAQPTRRLIEQRVALDFQLPGSEGSAERQSG